MAVRQTITLYDLPIQGSTALDLNQVNALIANLGRRGLTGQPLGRESFRQAQLPSVNKALRAKQFIDASRARLFSLAAGEFSRQSRNDVQRQLLEFQNKKNKKQSDFDAFAKKMNALAGFVRQVNEKNAANQAAQQAQNLVNIQAQLDSLQTAPVVQQKGNSFASTPDQIITTTGNTPGSTQVGVRKTASGVGRR